MARFTHIARANDEKRILRNGIKPAPYGDGMKGVYAMPVLPDFFASHQWLRELRQDSPSQLIAVDFVIADEETVWVGHYAAPHAEMTAAEAAGTIMQADDPRGYEVVILRKVTPDEIKRTRRVRQIVGWRYWPDAHGRPPCSCDVCQKGRFKGAALRRP